MPDSKRRIPQFLLLFFLPVLLVSLIAVVVNLVFWERLREEFRQTTEQQAREIRDMSVAIGFDQEIANIQQLVLSTHEEAAAGGISEAEIYLVHSDVVDRLAALAEQLPAIERISATDEAFSGVKKAFESFRNAIIQATDLAVIDPPGAMRQAFQASRFYIALSSRTGSMAQQVVTATTQRAASQYELFSQHAKRIEWMGGVLVLA